MMWYGYKLNVLMCSNLLFNWKAKEIEYFIRWIIIQRKYKVASQMTMQMIFE
jgi:hypothetical protein